MKYPIRCRIVDVTGMTKKFVSGIEFELNTPDISKPHIGKEGLAEKMDNGNVKITLDDGTIIYGYECWWLPLESDKPLEKPSET